MQRPPQLLSSVATDGGLSDSRKNNAISPPAKRSSRLSSQFHELDTFITSSRGTFRNEVPLSEIANGLPPEVKVISPSVTPETTPVKTRPVLNINLSQSPLAVHLRRMPNASSEEIMFFLCVVELGVDQAIYLASKYRWKIKRPLRELRALMRERGYTKPDSETSSPVSYSGVLRDK